MKKNPLVLPKTPHRRPRWQKIVLGISVLGMGIIVMCLAVIIFWPDVAAQNIDRLRDLIGDEPVAQLEDTVFSIKDNIQQWEYKVGLLKSATPWADVHPDQAINPVLPTLTTEPLLTEVAIMPTKPSNLWANTVTPLLTFTPLPRGVITATTAPTPTNPPIANSQASWQPTTLTPIGNLTGEGHWSPYLVSTDHKLTLAYRTFLQPDPKRPYSFTAIVAFDLRATRLHFVLGTLEPIPKSPQPSRTGTIPAADLQLGVLLATFNGGFKARHGQFGAMANGLVALPPIDGLATVAIYTDGRVQIGEWGTDIQDSSDLVAWRQNSKMLIRNGQINPATAQATEPWGKTIKGETITWRSALGLSADNRTLYYGVGLQLDVPTLAKAMAQAGAADALELDVNNYWVHFAAMHRSGSSLVAEPLLEAMNLQADRYLKGWSRDFFYITVAPK